MATVVIPPRKIRVALATYLSKSSALPSPIRRILKMWLFPHILRDMLDRLSNKLGKLTREEARDLYEPSHQLHLDVTSVLRDRLRWPPLMQALSARWSEEVSGEADKLEDIVEALAGGSRSAQAH